MKKVIKIFIISICTFLAICQINSNVYSYTIEEVKEAIEFKTVEEAGVPAAYDVLINAEDLIENVEFPYIESSIENILYVEDGLVAIDFFNVNSTNTNQKWLVVSGVVKNFFHIFLYIGFALLLTFLIYFSVRMVISVFSERKSADDTSKKNNENFKKNIRVKKTIEQWILLVILLPSIILIINLIVSFSGAIIDIIDINNLADEEYNYVVYVKSSEGDNDPQKNYYFKTNIEGLLMFESQYDWQKAPLKNIANIISGFSITTFKYILKAVFFIRMIMLAALTMFAPIIILMNSFLKISGSRGIFNKWLKIYLYLIFIKPLIAVLFYLLIGIHPDLISKVSLYSLIVILAMIVIIILSVYFLIRSLRK